MGQYSRGTATHRKTTAALVNGDDVLVGATPDGRLFVTYRKTGALVKTVSHLSFHMSTVSGGRQQRRYTVHFQDGTTAADNAPSQGWHVVTGSSYVDVAMPRIDSTGTAHTDHCWRMAHVALNEEVALQTLPAAAEWYEPNERVAIWDDALVSNVIADWLSDGTTSCICNPDD
jgi:hypothetical protein